MEKTMQCAVRLVATLLLCALLSCTCDYTVGERAASPSFKYAAITKGIGCGATVSYQSIVLIERPYRILGHSVWTASSGIFTAKVNLYQLKIHWADDHRLVVDCQCKKEDVGSKDSQWRDVTVEYRFSQ